MKLVIDERVRNYELTYLLPAVYTDAEMSKLTEGVATAIKKQGASIVSSDTWGKKKLAYRMKHGGKMHTEAHYFHVVFEAGTLKAQAIEHEVQLQPQIMRHLMVVAEPDSGNVNEVKTGTAE